MAQIMFIGNLSYKSGWKVMSYGKIIIGDEAKPSAARGMTTKSIQYLEKREDK